MGRENGSCGLRWVLLFIFLFLLLLLLLLPGLAAWQTPYTKCHQRNLTCCLYHKSLPLVSVKCRPSSPPSYCIFVFCISFMYLFIYFVFRIYHLCIFLRVAYICYRCIIICNFYFSFLILFLTFISGFYCQLFNFHVCIFISYSISIWFFILFIYFNFYLSFCILNISLIFFFFTPYVLLYILVFIYLFLLIIIFFILSKGFCYLHFFFYIIVYLLYS